MQYLKDLDSRVQFVVLYDAGSNFESLKYFGVETVVVPNSFQPLKAKYKARALEYFRQIKEFNDDVWILHLDEETNVNDHTILSCFDFIERNVEYDYGQVSTLSVHLLARVGLNHSRELLLTTP